MESPWRPWSLMVKRTGISTPSGGHQANSSFCRIWRDGALHVEVSPAASMEEILIPILGVPAIGIPRPNWYPIVFLDDRVLLNWRGLNGWRWTVLYDFVEREVVSATTPPPRYLHPSWDDFVSEPLASETGRHAVGFWLDTDGLMSIVVTDNDFEIVYSSGIGKDPYGFERTLHAVVSPSGNRIALVYPRSVWIAPLFDGVLEHERGFDVSFPLILDNPYNEEPEEHDFVSLDLGAFSEDGRFFCVTRAIDQWSHDGTGPGNWTFSSTDHEVFTIDCENESVSVCALPGTTDGPSALMPLENGDELAVLTGAGKIGVINCATGGFRSEVAGELGVILDREFRVMGDWIVTLQDSVMEVFNWEGESLLRTDLPASGTARYSL